ncbi:hypothetical protein [Streptomyces winkii]|uniref:hypothetical protein n=1 Tax=Streptomyces winkii TaxID=3051178 RepID=UPI0028D25333|nr:hypothetical protein [Streptomyces sp. DSM 40971]
MAAFNTAQFETAIEKINRGLWVGPDQLKKIVGRVNELLNSPLIPDPVKKAIKWSAQQLVSLTDQLLEKLVEIVKGSAAPLLMFRAASDWGDHYLKVHGDIKGPLDALASRRDWHGPAAERYENRVSRQPVAVGQIGGIAKKMADILTTSAGAGLVFYVAIAGAVAQFLGEMVACYVAVATGEGAAAGLSAAGVAVGANITLLVTSVGALTTFLTGQVSAVNDVKNKAQDTYAFPGGLWPVGTPSS